MAYAEISDLTARLADELALLVADADQNGVPDDAVLQAALDDADAEIDQAIGARYVTPVSPAPDALRRIAADLAIHFLFLRKREALPRERAHAAAAARGMLSRIAVGRAELQGAAPRLRGLESESTTRESPRVFDRGGLESF